MIKFIIKKIAVADPGFDLRGSVDFVNVFLVIFLLKLCLKLIASEASEENFKKNLAFWA